MIASLGGILFTGCNASGREFSQINRRGYWDCPKITLGWGANEKSGTGDAYNVKLAYNVPGGTTVYGYYTGGFSYDANSGTAMLLNNNGPFRRVQRVYCGYYDRGYDSVFICGERFG